MEAPSPRLGTRRVGVRRILEVSPFPGQAGYPASMDTDALPGYAPMGYHPAGALGGTGDAGTL